jgi:hypothetical protein
VRWRWAPWARSRGTDAAAQSGAAVAFHTTVTDVTLRYHVDDGVADIVERVPLERVAAGFGGTRAYFRCPGTGCGQRVMVLYLVNGLFRCRCCHGLAYECQREDARRRAGRRADKARARLGYPAWQPFTRTPMMRPKGMSRSKFWRLEGAALAADYDATEAFVTDLQSLAARLDRQTARRRGRQMS